MKIVCTPIFYLYREFSFCAINPLLSRIRSYTNAMYVAVAVAEKVPFFKLLDAIVAMGPITICLLS